MSHFPPPGDPRLPPPRGRRPWETGTPERREDGRGATVGIAVGILAPITITVLTWWGGGSLPGLGLYLMLNVVPVFLFVSALGLMIPKDSRSSGVGCMATAGVWLVTSSGLCFVLL